MCSSDLIAAGHRQTAEWTGWRGRDVPVLLRPFFAELAIPGRRPLTVAGLYPLALPVEPTSHVYFSLDGAAGGGPHATMANAFSIMWAYLP